MARPKKNIQPETDIKQETPAVQEEPAEETVAETSEAVTQETTAVQEPAVQQAAPVFTEAQVQQMIAEALAKQAANIQPQTVMVHQSAEKVTMRWQAEVADDNVAVFGDGGYFGRVTGRRGYIHVPKEDFFTRFLDERTRFMLDKRWLVVLAGLDDEERAMLGVDYKEGEILDDKAFVKLLDMTDEELLEVFPDLCESHREMVAKRITEAYSRGDAKITKRRDLVKRLNDISKAGYQNLPDGDGRKRGLLATVLEDMNEKEL